MYRRYGICLAYAFACSPRYPSYLFIFLYAKQSSFLFCFLCQSNQCPFLYIRGCEAVSDRNWGFNSPDAPAEKGPTDSVLIKDKCSFFRSELNIYASRYLMEIVGYKRQDLQASDDNDHVDDNDRRVNWYHKVHQPDAQSNNLDQPVLSSSGGQSYSLLRLQLTFVKIIIHVLCTSL